MRLAELVQRAKRDALALYLALRHPDTPIWVKAGLLLAVAYALSPIDLIPDFIPVLGYLDEVVLLTLVVTLATRFTPAGVLDDCRREADLWLADGRRAPRLLAGVVLISAIWLVVGVTLWRWLAA